MYLIEKSRMLDLSGFERSKYKIHKSAGNANRALLTFDLCAVALGRYAVLFSTAPRPFRLSALQNACVCPCIGAYYNAEIIEITN